MKEDDKHRAVIILAYDDSQETRLHTDECVIGCKGVLVPAMAHTQKSAIKAAWREK